MKEGGGVYAEGGGEGPAGGLNTRGGGTEGHSPRSCLDARRPPASTRATCSHVRPFCASSFEMICKWEHLV